MTTFDTPEPIATTIELAVADLRIVASRRSDTDVSVSPRDPGSAADVKAAEQTHVTYENGHLVVRAAPKKSLTTRGAVKVTVDLPEGSRLEAGIAAGNLRGEGRLGDTKVCTTHGEIELERTGELELSAGAGEIRISATGGAAMVRTVKGDIRVGEATGALYVSTAQGNIDVGQAMADVQVKSGYGDIRVSEVVQGAISVETSAGKLAIGVRQGTAARLNVDSIFGAVKNLLDTLPESAPTGKSVDVRACTGRGDIVIHRP